MLGEGAIIGMEQNGERWGNLEGRTETTEADVCINKWKAERSREGRKIKSTLTDDDNGQRSTSSISLRMHF